MHIGLRHHLLIYIYNLQIWFQMRHKQNKKIFGVSVEFWTWIFEKYKQIMLKIKGPTYLNSNWRRTEIKKDLFNNKVWTWIFRTNKGFNNQLCYTAALIFPFLNIKRTKKCCDNTWYFFGTVKCRSLLSSNRLS
jgi:hypothetical protein